MIICDLILIFSFLLIEIKFCKYFIQGYYSYKRYYKGILVLFKRSFLYIYFLFAMISFLLSFQNLLLANIIIIISNIYLLFLLPKSSIHFKRRGYLLYLVSLLSLLSYYYLKYFLAIIMFISLPLYNLLLLPFEKKIQEKYLKKARSRIKEVDPLIIGITGSFGKTTFKEYLFALLNTKYNVLKSEGNINTLMGLTKFINEKLDSSCKILILEMGIDENHGLQKFKKLCKLDIGVIVGVGKVHLATFKTYENVIKSKCEMEDLLKDNGILFANGNYKELKEYSFKKNAVFYYSYNIDDNKLNKFQKSAIDGVHKISDYLFVEKTYFNYFLHNLPLVKRRFEIKTYKETTLINDSYNINFDALKEDFIFLKKYPCIKIFITGGLIELKEEFYKLNYEIGKLTNDIDYIFLISKNKMHPLKKGCESINKKVYLFASLDKALTYANKIQKEKVILLSAKGSDYFLQ